MYDMERIVSELMEQGGVKIKMEDSYNEGINFRWKLNARLRETGKKHEYSTAIIWEEGLIVIVAWSIHKFGSKRLNKWIEEAIGNYVYISAPAATKTVLDGNLDNSDKLIDESKKEILDKLAHELKLKQQSKRDETLNKLLEQL